MATARPELNTPEGVLNFYESQPDRAALFAIYAGHRVNDENCRFIFEGEDKLNGMAELSAICAAMQANPANTNVYILQVFEGREKGKKINVRSVTFQLNNPLPGYYNPTPTQQFRSNDLAEIAERIGRIESQLNEEPEPEPEPKNKFLEILETVLANPTFQEKAIGFISNLFQKKPPMQISGIDEVSENTSFENDLQTLREVVPDFENVISKLAKMAIDNPSQIKMLLTFL